MYHIDRLENGLTVATAEMPHMASVSVGLWAAAGSRYEPESLNGVSHFIEHMLFKGTPRRNAREISEAVEGIGGYLNAFTSEESTCFHARACRPAFAELLDVLFDMYLNARFTPADIRREREVIKEEISMYIDQPQQQVQELFNTTLWPGHMLGRSITGSHASVDRIGRAEMLAFKSHFYGSGSTVVTVAGGIEHARVLEAVRPYARRLAVGHRQGYVPVRPVAGPRVALETRTTEQTQLALGFRTCSRHDPRRYPLRVLNALLGENMSSRLFQLVREQRGLTYNIYSAPSHFEDTGDLVITAGLDADELETTLGLVLRVLRQLGDQVVSRGELRRAKDYIIGQFDLGMESTETQMNWVGEQLLGHGEVQLPARVRAEIQAVTAAQVRATARDFFQPDRLAMALVSPLRRVRPWHKLVSSWTGP